MTSSPSIATRILDWLRGGYPEGVPSGDYIALLGILHRRLTTAEVQALAGDLAAEAADSPPLTAEDVRALIADRIHEDADDESVARVSARLAAGGWPLAPLRDGDTETETLPAAPQQP